MKLEGGCQCGAVRFEAELNSFDAYLCHCRMCQRATGNVSIAFVNLQRSAMSWLSDPAWYQSSPIARRPFCAHCGTPLGFEFLEGENLDLCIGAFDDPSKFVPTHNFGTESRHHKWEDTSHLPGQRADEWEPTLRRWRNAGSNPPQ